MKENKWAILSILTAIIGVIAASLCCIAPLILLAFGIGGAWVGSLTHLAFLRPIGIIVAVVFLILAFWKLYITPKRCKTNHPCANPRSLTIQRWVFWIAVILLVLVITFPYYAHLFY